jgi:NAD+ kinase
LGLPILGINLGHFRFPDRNPARRWREMLAQLLRGDYRLEERMLLHAEHWRGQSC